MSTIKSPNEPAAPAEHEQSPGSINEPPGSNVVTPAAPQEEQQRDPLPSNGELHAMKRVELDDLAAERGVDISAASNKDEVIELLRKDARKRR